MEEEKPKEEEVPEPKDDEAAERAEQAEAQMVTPRTILHTTYRGRK